MTTKTLEKRTPAEASAVERTRNKRVIAPAVDIFEETESLTLVADMPGVDPKNISIQFEAGELTLSASAGERAREGGERLLNEYEPGDYFRTFQISETIDSGRISAEYRDGVLKLTLPKVEAAKPRRITVTAK